jgi:CRISPR-associated protein Cas1
MPTAILNQPGTRIGLSGLRLEVFEQDMETRQARTLREIPLRDLDRLLMAESVHITTPALVTLLKNDIPIGYLGGNGEFVGGFYPALNTHGESRIRQYRATCDPEFCLRTAGRIIVAKVYNQRRTLQRLASGRKGTPQDGLDETLTWMQHLMSTLSKSKSLEELRGYEGITTARYFHAWASFLPSTFPFEHRSTRPPHNAVNACISFGATLLYTEMVAAIHGIGLDPALGALHTTENGRWSLALDLMEPFRPVLVEALALDLFSHQILNASHFHPQNGGIYLNQEGRHRFFLQYERRMERQFMSESVGHRTNLRQQLEAQASMLKSSLETPDAFEPFVMN